MEIRFGKFALKSPASRDFQSRLAGDDKAKMKTIVRRNFLFIKRETELIKAITLFNDENS